VRRPIRSHQNRATGHAFAADQADLDAPATGTAGDNRREPGFEKVHVVNRLVGLLQARAQWQIDPLEIGLEEQEVLRREAGQQTIRD
jgi:hypothetical protein